MLVPRYTTTWLWMRQGGNQLAQGMAAVGEMGGTNKSRGGEAAYARRASPENITLFVEIDGGAEEGKQKEALL